MGVQELFWARDTATQLWLDDFYLRHGFTMDYVEQQAREKMVHVTPEYEQLISKT